jgi:hypothetical protein
MENIIKNAKYIYAKSMPSFPHEYTLRSQWQDDKQFCDAANYIRENGVKKKFGKKEYIYLYIDGYKYWKMGNPISYTDKTKTILINRAKV